MQAHILYLHTLSTTGVGSKVKTFFSESSHVAYQIDENGAQGTMQAHILSLHIPSTPWVDSTGQNPFFTENSHVNIRLKGMEHRAPC